MIKNLLKNAKKKFLPYALAANMALTYGSIDIKDITPQIKPKNEVTEYALLINGDAHTAHHEANISMAASKLIEIGYDADNIICLAGEDSRGSLPKHIHKLSTARSLEEALLYLQEQVDSNDILLVYTTGHGYRKDDKSYLALFDAGISSTGFAKILNQINFGQLIFVADQCFSGDFVDKIDDFDRNIVTMSDTDAEHETYCQFFAEGFWGAIGDSQYDTNGDGNVNALEAYNEGMKRHKSELGDRPEDANGQFSIRRMDEPLLLDTDNLSNYLMPPTRIFRGTYSPISNEGFPCRLFK